MSKRMIQLIIDGDLIIDIANKFNVTTQAVYLALNGVKSLPVAAQKILKENKKKSSGYTGFRKKNLSRIKKVKSWINSGLSRSEIAKRLKINKRSFHDWFSNNKSEFDETTINKARENTLSQISMKARKRWSNKEFREKRSNDEKRRFKKMYKALQKREPEILKNLGILGNPSDVARLMKIPITIVLKVKRNFGV